jgi:diguanylate cyclase (GGDEF)-like protein/PAS domain S-box-containing protein
MSQSLVHLQQEQLEQIVNLSGDVVYQADASGRVSFVNSRVQDVLGFSPESLIGAHYLVWVAPEARAETYRFYAEQARKGVLQTYHEFPALCRDGKRIWVGQHVQLLLDEDTTIGFHGIVRDVSELRRIAGDLRGREERMHLLSELASATGTERDRITDGLQKACALLDLRRGVVSRIHGDKLEVVQYWPPEAELFEGQQFALEETYGDLTVRQGRAVAIAHVGKSEHAAHPALEAFGLECYIGAPIFVGGRLVGTVSFTSPDPRSQGFPTADVDFVSLLARWVGTVLEQSVALERIQSAEGRLKSIVEVSADGVATCSDLGKILSMNHAAQQMLGLVAEPLGEDIRFYLPGFLKALGRTSADAVPGTVAATPTSGTGPDLIVDEGVRPDGEAFNIELTVTRTHHGAETVLAGVFRDVSARNRHGDQIRRREAALRSFFDGTPFLMGILSLRSGRLVHLSANASAIEFFGLLHPNGSSAELGAVGNLPDAGRWERACGRALAERRPVRFETRVRERWLNVTVNVIDDVSGAPRFSYVVDDVTAEHAQALELGRRTAEFEAIYRAIPHAAIFAKTDRSIVAVNPAFGRIFGYDSAEALGKDGSFLFAESEESLTRAMDSADGGPTTFNIKYRRRDGTAFDAETIRVPVSGNDGTALGSLALIRDVTERNATRERVRTQADILTHVRDAVVVLDQELRITYWNGGAESLTGFTPAEAEGRRLVRVAPFRWLHVDQEQEAVHALINHGTWKGRLRIRARDKQVVFVDAVVSLMRDSAGETSGMLVVARDVTETVKLERQLRHQARADALTDLPNRKVLDERVREAIRRRDEEGEAFALVFIDMDQFKLVNDSLGHAVGDALLLQAAARIKSSLRAEDFVARIGGDEFAVLIADAGSEFETRQAMDRLATALNRPFRVSGNDLPCSASMGIVMGDMRYHEPAELLRDADTAMYEAKRRARGTFVVFSEAMHETVKRRFRLGADLTSAVLNHELELYYQPIVRLTDGKIAGFEALVRWNHIEFGLLRPDEFLPVATEMGCLGEIDRWVVREAAAQLSCWLASSPKHADLVMHINSSSDTVLTTEYRETVRGAIAEFQLPPDALEIEITEHLLISDPAAAASRLDALKAIGVRLSIDDFGTGFSSLNLLHSLPVDTIKTDRSLLDPANTGNRSHHILDTIAKLSGALGLGLVGEGIETEEQLQRLRNLGFGYGQGYLLSKARPAPHAERLLRTPGWVGYWEADSEARTSRPPVRLTPRQSSTESPKSGIDTRS